jgi:hypothetical protein
MSIRESLGPLTIALLCILAFGLAAATLSSPVDTSKEGGGQGAPSEGGISSNSSGSGEIDANITSNSEQLAEYTRNEGLCVEQAKAVPFWPTVFGIAGLVALVVLSRFGYAWGMTSFIMTAMPVFIVLLLLTAGCMAPPDPDIPTDPPDVNSSEAGGEGEDGKGEAEETTDETTLPISVPSMIVAFFVLATTVLLSFVLFRRRERTAAPGEEMEAPDATEPTKAVGAVAGEAADEIEAEGSDLENEVYRAWAEMAAALDVDHPDTSTPAEFAEAATEAGIRPDDVRELTSLFEQVRYGTADATSDREQRAVDALRRIERYYADDGESE